MINFRLEINDIDNYNNCLLILLIAVEIACVFNNKLRLCNIFIYILSYTLQILIKVVLEIPNLFVYFSS